MNLLQALGVAAVGTRVTTGASAVATAIPVANNGEKPRYVVISCVDAAASVAHVRPTGSSASATNADIPVAFGAPVILHVGGFSHISHIQGSAAAVIVITPLENQK